MADYMINLGVNIDWKELKRLLKNHDIEIDADLNLDMKDAQKGVRTLAREVSRLDMSDANIGQSLYKALSKALVLFDAVNANADEMQAEIASAGDPSKLKPLESVLRSLASIITEVTSKADLLDGNIASGMKDIFTIADKLGASMLEMAGNVNTAVNAMQKVSGGNTGIKSVATEMQHDAEKIGNAGKKAEKAASDAVSGISAAEATDSPIDTVADQMEKNAEKMGKAGKKAKKAASETKSGIGGGIEIDLSGVIGKLDSVIDKLDLAANAINNFAASGNALLAIRQQFDGVSTDVQEATGDIKEMGAALSGLPDIGVDGAGGRGSYAQRKAYDNALHGNYVNEDMANSYVGRLRGIAGRYHTDSSVKFSLADALPYLIGLDSGELINIQKELSRGTRASSQLDAHRIVIGRSLEQLAQMNIDADGKETLTGIQLLDKYINGSTHRTRGLEVINGWIGDATDAKSRPHVSVTPSMLSSMNYARKTPVTTKIEYFQPSVLGEVHANNRQLGSVKRVSSRLGDNYGLPNDWKLLFDMAKHSGLDLAQIDAKELIPIVKEIQRRTFMSLPEELSEDKLASSYSKSLNRIKSERDAKVAAIQSQTGDTSVAKASASVESMADYIRTNARSDVEYEKRFEAYFDSYEEGLGEKAKAALAKATSGKTGKERIEGAKELSKLYNEVTESALDIDVDAEKARLKEIESEKKSIRAQSDEVQKSKSKLKSEISDRQLEIDTIDKKLGDKDSYKYASQEVKDDLRKRKKNLQAQISRRQQKLSELESGYDDKLSELDKEEARIKDRIAQRESAVALKKIESEQSDFDISEWESREVDSGDTSAYDQLAEKQSQIQEEYEREADRLQDKYEELDDLRKNGEDIDDRIAKEFGDVGDAESSLGDKSTTGDSDTDSSSAKKAEQAAESAVTAMDDANASGQKLDTTLDGISGESMREAAGDADKLESSIDGVVNAAKMADALDAHFSTMSDEEVKSALEKAGYQKAQYDAYRSQIGTEDGDILFRDMANEIISANGIKLDIDSSSVGEATGKVEVLGTALTETESKAESTDAAIDGIDGGSLREAGEDADKAKTSFDSAATAAEELGDKAKGALPSSGSGGTSDVENSANNAAEALRKLLNISNEGSLSVTQNGIENIENSMRELGFSDDVIDPIISKIREMGLEITKTSAVMDGNDTLKFNVQGKNDVGDAIQLVARLADVSNDIKVTDISVKVSTDQAKAAAKAQKEVNDEFRKYKTLMSDIAKLQRTRKSAIANNKSEAEIADIDRQIKDKVKEAQTIRIKTEFDDSQLGEIKRLGREIKSQDISLDVDIETNKINRDFNTLMSKLRDLSKAEVRLAGLTELDEDFEDAQRAVSKLRVEVSGLEAELGGSHGRISLWNQGDLNDEQFKQYCNTVRQGAADVQDAADKMVKAHREMAQSAADSLGANGLSTTRLKSLNRDISNISNPSENANNAVAGYAKAYHNLEEALDRYNNAVSEYGANSNQAIAAAHAMANAQDDLEKAYKDATNAIKQNKDVSRDAEANERFLLNQQKILTSMDAWEKKNDRVMNGNSQKAKELAEEFVTLRRRIEECDNAADLAKLNTELSTFKNKVKAAGLEGESAFTKLKNKFQEYASYAAASMGIMEIIQGLQQMAQEVIEVDTAMTGLYRVTELTADQYDELYDKMVSSAKEYGRTLTDTINATSDWVKAGFDDTDLALELAEITAMYQNISDLDYDTAAENLITAYNGFKPYFTDAEQFGNDVAGSVMHITDVLNQLDNEFSVTSAGLGESMTRSASALEMAGNTFEESVAMAGAITEVTQDPEKAGSALKILSLRLRGMKGALQEMGEEVDDNVENISKMQGQILNMTHGDVNIFNDDGSFKSTYKIMDEIAEVWEDLSSIEKADLLETIAGKNRANEVSALISAWGQAEDMKESALNAAGSAAEENAKKVESLEGRLNALTATWQAFANTVMESNLLKGLISTATSFLDVITQIIDKFGTLPTLIGLAFGAVKFTSFKDILPIQIVKDEATDLAKSLEFTFGKTVKNIASSMRTNTGSFNFGDTLSNAISDMDLIERYNSALRNGEGVDQALSDIQNGASESAQRYAQTMTTVTEAQRSSAEASADCLRYMQKEDVARQAQSKKLTNVNNLLNGYNDEAKRAGMSQKEYAEQCGKSNSVLGSYLRGLDGAKASMTGYVGSLISATAKTVLLEAASLALNAALTMGVSALISLGISAISKMITAADDLAKKIEEVTSSYKTQHDELTKNKAGFDELAESYAKLEKGVDDSTGKNIGLTTSEYKEYQDVVNQIADMVPSLVKGYDEQGNAIIDYAGNVDSLTEAYKNLIIEQNNALLNGDGEDYNGISDISDDLDNNYDDMADSGIWGDKLTMLGAGQLEKILNSSEIDEDVVAKYAGNMTTQIGTSLKDALEEKGLELEGVEIPAWYSSRDTWENFIAEACKQHPAVAQEIINSMDAEMDTAVQEMRTAIGAHMENAFLNGDYSNIDSEMQTIAESIVGGLDSKLIMRLNESGGEDAVTNYVDNILKSINNLTETESEVLKGSFDLSSKFESGELSYGEYRAQLENAVKSIEAMGFDKEVESQLKLSLNVDEVNENYEAIKNRLTSDKFDIQMSTEEAEDFLSGLSSSEYSILMSMDLSNVSVDELESLVKDAAKLAEATSYTIDITAETEGIEALNTALAESRSATGLTIESMEALEGRYRGLNSYDAATLFQETANGISLNADALRKCESEYNKLQLDETTNSLETMKGEYDRLTEAIMNETDATKKSQLVNEREDIRSKITDLAELATMYEGLTSSYNEWQNAESSGNDRDMYTTVHSAMEGVDKELELGWIDDGTMEYFQLIWGEDKWDGAGKSIEDYRKKWNTLDDTIAGTSYSIQDFFKTNEDGELTSEGIFNFFDAVGEKQKELGEDWIKYDDDGNIDSFNFGVDGDKAIADALGISEEMVQIFLRAAEDAGFVVNFDGTYTQLANLQNEAMAANDKLKEIGKTDYTFDFNSTSLTDLNEQLGKAKEILKDESFWNADGTFNFDAEGATEAMQIVSTLQATIDNLDNKYIGLTVEDEAFEEPLEKAQDYESKVATLNQLELNPKANAEEIEALKEDLDGIVQYFAELDDGTKKKLGIPVELEGDDLDKKIEEMLGDGTLKIPTVLDLQTNMNENIEDLVKLSLYNSGMLTEDEKLEIEQEFKLKYVSSDDSEGSEEIDEKAQEDAENAGEDPITVNQEVDFEFETPTERVEGVLELLDGLEIAEKDQEVVVDFVVNNKEEFEALSEEERQVVVDLITDDNALESLEEHQVEIEAFANIFGVEEVDDLKAKLDGLGDEQILVLAEVLGKVDVEKLKTTVDGLDDKTVQAIAEALGKGDVDGLKTTINGLDGKTVQAIAEAFGYSSVEELNGAIDNLDPKTVQAIAQALGITDVNSLRGAVNRLGNKTVKAAATVNGKDDVISLKSALDNLKDKTVTVWAQIKQRASDLLNKVTGGGGVDGTAHVDGTAFAEGTVRKSGKAFKQGNWGTKEDGTALVGELGAETLVRDGRYYVIGEDSAEFIKYKKGDIIFNAAQTEELFSKGKIKHGSGRGKALSSGTAFASGTLSSTGLAFSSGTGADNPWSDNSSSSSSSSKSSKSSSSSSSSSSSDDAEEFKEKLDWIEIAIDRIERAISKLDLTASSVFKKWSTRNSALAKQIAKVGEEIDLQERGAARYLQEANSVGLSESYASKVRNGTIDIETITDEDLKEKIDEYQEWYEKYLDCIDAAEELRETENELYAQKLDNVVTQYEGIISLMEHEKNMLEEFINQSEANAWLVSANYYKALKSSEQERLAELKEEEAMLLATFNDIMKDSSIDETSEQWVEMCEAINDVTLAIAESETALMEYQQTLQQLNWEVFDLLQDRISKITDESEFLIDLMSSDKLYDDKGQFTDQGTATAGLYGVNYNVAMAQADQYAEEIKKIEKELAKDPFDTDLKDRYYELVEAQQDAILSAQDYKENIRDLVEEGIELELDALNELIDKHNEALDSQKDLYDYQKKVKEQTEEIASIEKQIAAYSNSDAEEDKKKIQELKVSLEEAKQDLEETEYDQYITDQERLLDELYLEYETILNERLDNLDLLISDMIAYINENATSISDTISTEADAVGYDLSEAMKTIWNNQSFTDTSNSINSVITTYGDKFLSSLTTTNAALNNISTDIESMIGQLNKIAGTNVKSAQQSAAAKAAEAAKKAAAEEAAKKATTNKTTTTKTTSGDGTPKVGDKVKFVSGKYYYDSQGKSPIGSKYQGKEVYITSINNASWATHPYHISTGSKLGSGDLGWLKLNQLSGYATGKKNFLSDELGWTQENGREFIIRPSDGAILTPLAKGDSVLNAAASSNLWNMANNPADFIRESLGIGDINAPAGSGGTTSISQNFENVVFSFPAVKNYEQMLSAMSRDKNFERLINAMTVDQLAGKSSLGKGKAIR